MTAAQECELRLAVRIALEALAIQAEKLEKGMVRGGQTDSMPNDLSFVSHIRLAAQTWAKDLRLLPVARDANGNRRKIKLRFSV